MRQQLAGEKEAVREIVRVEKLVRKTCEAPGCGKEILALSRQRFCSTACRTRFNYHKNIEKYRAAKTARYQAAKARKKKQASA